MPPALQKAADLLPLTQGIKLLKAAALGRPVEMMWMPLGVMVVFAVCSSSIAVRFFKWE